MPESELFSTRTKKYVMSHDCKLYTNSNQQSKQTCRTESEREGDKGRRNEGRKVGRKEEKGGRKEGRKGGREEERKEGRKNKTDARRASKLITQ